MRGCSDHVTLKLSKQEGNHSLSFKRFLLHMSSAGMKFYLYIHKVSAAKNLLDVFFELVHIRFYLFQENSSKHKKGSFRMIPLLNAQRREMEEKLAFSFSRSPRKALLHVCGDCLRQSTLPGLAFFDLLFLAF